MKIKDLLVEATIDSVWYGPRTFETSAATIPQFFKDKENSESVNYSMRSVLVNLAINRPAKNEDVEAAIAMVHSGYRITQMHSDPKMQAALKAKLPKTPTAAMMAVVQDILDEHAIAEYLAADIDVRNWLIDAGFDGYIDHSILFNEEPLQAIVFSPSQISSAGPM